MIKRYILTIFFILFLANNAVAEPINKELLKQEVINLDIERGKALQNKDMNFLNDLYDDAWVYMTPWGTNFNKVQYFEQIKNITYKKLDYKYLNARCPQDDTVILNLINSVEFILDNKTTKEEFFYTRIYVKKNGKWKFISQQGTKK